MEALKGYISTVEFIVPNELPTATFTVKKNGVAVGTTYNATIDGTVASATLPYAAVVDETELLVELSFTYEAQAYTQQQHIRVSTPILPLNQIGKILDSTDETEQREVEAIVRYIIENFTGQSFGYSKDETLTVEAHGESALRLPKRLVVLKGLSTLTSVLDPKVAVITSDGWYLKKGWSREVTPKESDSLYWSGWEINTTDPGEPGFEKAHHGHVIVAPGGGGTPTAWRSDYPFEITGDWGYITPPGAVVEAAKLLVNDYACQETMYRDKYLQAIKSADWHLNFSSQAWDHTGNVRADKLLSDYVLMDWAVV